MVALGTTATQSRELSYWYSIHQVDRFIGATSANSHRRNRLSQLVAAGVRRAHNDSGP